MMQLAMETEAGVLIGVKCGWRIQSRLWCGSGPGRGTQRHVECNLYITDYTSRNSIVIELENADIFVLPFYCTCRATAADGAVRMLGAVHMQRKDSLYHKCPMLL
jgi:hypothetical protein